MDTRVRALVWEEIRVSGAIAACTLAGGLLCLLSFRIDFVSMSMTEDAYFFVVALAAPMAVALLLILNPGYSGILAGGYSQRILHLPISTSMTVAVTLFIRTLLVSIVTMVTVLATRQLFNSEPLGFEWVLFVTLLYLGAQLLDWLRAPVSGLSSLLLLLLVSIPVGIFVNDGKDLEYMVSSIKGSSFLNLRSSSLIVACVFIGTYFVAVPVVHLARTGRQFGIPEIWEWPKRIAFNPTSRVKPFSSPVAAQVGFEFRRSGWIVPVGTLSVFLLAAGALWLRTGSLTIDSLGHSLLAYVPFAGALLAAAAQAGQRNIAGFRKSTGNPGYSYLQPLTDAQFAQARMIVNALCLLPTLLLATFLHFSVAGNVFVMDVIPHALELGVASYREIAWVLIWTLISRGLIVGLVAWTLLAITTRFLFKVTLISILMCVVVEFVGHKFYKVDGGFSFLPVSLLLCSIVVVAFTRAWRQGLLPLRTLLGWGFAWTLTTWLIYGNAWVSIVMLAPSPLWHLIGFISCLGLATLVPLPYIATLFDIRLRRHSGTPLQTRSQHTEGISVLWGTRRRVVASCTAVFVTVVIVWLGWPGRPAYEAVWKAKGHPVNLAELDAWYPAVAPEKNRALQYLTISKERRRLEFEFRNTLPQRWNVDISDTDVTYYQDNFLIFGNAEVKRGEAIPESTWINTELYWEGVTSQIAPVLKAFPTDGTSESRYPIDLQEGYMVNRNHLAKIRNLARELRLDALHWAVAGDSGQATDSILWIIPISNSLANEPTLWSQFVRISILSTAQAALEDAMNRVAFPDIDLERIQRAFESASPSSSEDFMLDRGLIGESILILGTILDIKNLTISPDAQHESALPVVPVNRLILPPVAEQIVISSYIEDTLQSSRLSWPEWQEKLDSDLNRLRETSFIAPLSSILLPSLRDSYGREWRVRTQFDVALTAVAVERYRLTHGRLPETLTELAPAFLLEVPVDYYSETGEPLRYRRWDNGKYVVYSVGRDMEDDHGEEITNWYLEGDITFTVAPVSERVDAGN